VIVRRALFVLFVLALGAAPALAERSAAGETSVRTLDTAVLVRLNAVRTAHGLAPLKANASLSAAAREHSSEMLDDGYFAHESFDGSPFWKRLDLYTQTVDGAGWSAAENLLWVSPSVDAARAVELWMQSPEHRENILAPEWREIGVAAIHAERAPGAFGDRAVTVITADFGVRR
jgi:uncharacterized protein YkwD